MSSSTKDENWVIVKGGQNLIADKTGQASLTQGEMVFGVTVTRNFAKLILTVQGRAVGILQTGVQLRITVVSLWMKTSWNMVYKIKMQVPHVCCETWFTKW